MVKVLPDTHCATLQPIIEADVAKGIKTHTDELSSYEGLEKKGYSHTKAITAPESASRRKDHDQQH
tara:strand:+ start:222 stop:419 length:198 start_codon:yes stop_codon:yes gene_type:complete